MSECSKHRLINDYCVDCMSETERDLRTALAEAQHEIESLEAGTAIPGYRKAVRNAELLNVRLRQEIADLERKLAVQHQAIKDASAMYEESERARLAAIDDRIRITESKADLEHKLAEAQVDHSRVDELCNDLSGQLSKRAEIEEELQRQLADLKAELAGVKEVEFPKRIDAVTGSFRKKIAELEAELARAKQYITDTEKQ